MDITLAELLASWGCENAWKDNPTAGWAFIGDRLDRIVRHAMNVQRAKEDARRPRTWPLSNCRSMWY